MHNSRGAGRRRKKGEGMEQWMIGGNLLTKHQKLRWRLRRGRGRFVSRPPPFTAVRTKPHERCANLYVKGRERVLFAG